MQCVYAITVFVLMIFVGCNSDYDCNNHGKCNKETHTCSCTGSYVGEQCNQTGGKVICKPSLAGVM